MDTIRWLVVGAGDIANKRVIPAIASEPRSRLAAVCDSAAERAEAAAEPHGAKVYTSMSDALKDDEIDAVYICTPVYLHAPQAIESMRAGKHALVEKPIALNYAEAKHLAGVAYETGMRCGAAYFRRFSPKYKMAQEMISTGEFGRIVLIRMTYFSWFNPAPDDPKYWRVVPEKSGGGPVSDMGAHMFDALIGLLGMPETIFARADTLVHPYKVEDSASAVLTMPGGAQATASFHWNSKTWSHEFEIVGVEAKVKWHPYDSGSVVKTVGRDIREVPTPNHENVHYPLVEDFASSIIEGRDPAVPASEAAKTNALVDALFLSSRERREVAVSEII